MNNELVIRISRPKLEIKLLISKFFVEKFPRIRQLGRILSQTYLKMGDL